jgi:hypothetical protein
MAKLSFTWDSRLVVVGYAASCFGKRTLWFRPENGVT